jgi:pre-mRNA-splicing factor 38A
MANVTDPLIKSVQGSDPQNLMEYITRQKIYDSRFWKEECFGLTAADVMEQAAKSLTCVGGTFSGMGKPTKFLSLTLKLLQLQPDKSVVRAFLEQDHFKYLRVLGAFYLRLTGRPQEIYELLDPLYADYSKLKYRDVNEWKLMYFDEFIDDLLTKPICCGIAMPRLPIRETLQEAGYLEEGPRRTALHDDLIEAGGMKEYLKRKVDQEVVRKQQVEKPTTSNEITNSTNYCNTSTSTSTSAISVWERRYGKLRVKKKKDDTRDSTNSEEDSETATNAIVGGGNNGRENQLDTTDNAFIDRPNSSSSSSITDGTEERKGKRKTVDNDILFLTEKKKKKEKKNSLKYDTMFKPSKEKKRSGTYGTLFKPSAVHRSKEKISKRSKDEPPNEAESKINKPTDQNSDEYWNDLRSSLGMNPLKK